jgi:hypothetical protein
VAKKRPEPAAPPPDAVDAPYIIPALRPLAVRLADLNLDPDNARLHPPESVDAIRRSLAELGQHRAAVVQRDGMRVRVGNGMVLAARQLGWEWIAAAVVDEDDVAATARSIADNKVGELSQFDPAALAKAAALVLSGTDGQILSTGFTKEEMSWLVRSQGLVGEGDDPANHWRGMPEFNQEDKTAYKTLHVHFKDQRAYEAFSRVVNQTLTPKTRAIWYPQAEIERYADKRYADESDVPDLHRVERSVGVASDGQGS